jgi:hypothetical protein
LLDLKCSKLKAARRYAPLDVGIWPRLEISEGNSLAASLALQTALPRFLSVAVFFEPKGVSGGFENQNVTVVQMDFGGLPSLAYFFAKASKHTLVETFGI